MQILGCFADIKLIWLGCYRTMAESFGDCRPEIVHLEIHIQRQVHNGICILIGHG